MGWLTFPSSPEGGIHHPDSRRGSVAGHGEARERESLSPEVLVRHLFSPASRRSPSVHPESGQRAVNAVARVEFVVRRHTTGGEPAQVR